METDREYILARIKAEDRGHDTPCWIWQRWCTRKGYGFGSRGGKNVRAHRLSYEAHVGTIPDGYEVDHLCRVRDCVNPAHLEAVTPEENRLRQTIHLGQTVGGKIKVRLPGVGKGGWQRHATHCVNGHEYPAERPFLRSKYRCPTCYAQRERNKNQYRRGKRAATRMNQRGEAARGGQLPSGTHTQTRPSSHVGQEAH